MSYKHLSQDERYHIQRMLKQKMKKSQMAAILGRSCATIYREIKRGMGARGYRPKQAQSLAEERSLASRNAYRISESIWTKVREKLFIQHSPEQIAAHIPVSVESIYRYVYADKRAGGNLILNLRCQKKRKKRYASGQNRRGIIPNRRGIELRPEHIKLRKQIGHWEVDTIIGAGHKQAIVSIVERKSGYALLRKVERKSAQEVSQAMIEVLKPIASKVKTLTYDNGLEFAAHEQVDKALGSTAYFADPYSSWQRGSNENTNGLVRQYVPKKRKLSTLIDEELQIIEDRLNNRPRKRLGFKTPAFVFQQSLNSVALRV